MNSALKQRVVATLALVASSATMQAQSWRESSLRIAPQSYSYSIKTPINEKVSEFAFPIFVMVPILPSLRVDVGTAYAMAHHERQVPDSTGGTFSTTPVVPMSSCRLAAHSRMMAA